jgi:hypothetical protein
VGVGEEVYAEDGFEEVEHKERGGADQENAAAGEDGERGEAREHFCPGGEDSGGLLFASGGEETAVRGDSLLDGLIHVAVQHVFGAGLYDTAKHADIVDDVEQEFRFERGADQNAAHPRRAFGVAGEEHDAGFAGELIAADQHIEGLGAQQLFGLKGIGAGTDLGAGAEVGGDASREGGVGRDDEDKRAARQGREGWRPWRAERRESGLNSRELDPLGAEFGAADDGLDEGHALDAVVDGGEIEVCR